MIKTQSQRIVVIISFILFDMVVVRGVLQYGGSADLAEGLVPLAIFFLLLVTEPSVSRRWGVYRGVYFGLQTVLVMRVGFVCFAPGTEDLDLAVDASGRILVLDPPGKALRIFAPVPVGKGKRR